MIIVDLDEVKVFDKETGLHNIDILNLKERQVITEDQKCYKFTDITFVHEV